MAYTGQFAEMVKYAAYNGDEIEAYYARPSGNGPFPGVVVLHHLPGWDEWTCEVVRKLAHHGFAAVSPNLYSRFNAPSPDEAAALARPTLGTPDAQVIGDLEGSMRFLRSQSGANGKVGCIGFCSGGRQAYLAAIQAKDLDAAVDCWGGGVAPHDRWPLTETRPDWPIDLTEKMIAPLLGIFGNDDQFPTPENVNDTEAQLKRFGKDYEFHRYDGAGHAFLATDRPNSRPEQAKDAWEKIFAFYDKRLRAG